MKQTRSTLMSGFALLSMFWLSACTVFPEADSQTIYQLPAPEMSASTARPLPLSMRISTPRAGSLLSSPRMLVNPRGNELQNYKDARWSDPVPALLREHLAHAFEQRSILAAVSTDENAFSADIHMSSDLRRFQVIYRGSDPSAIIELKVRLVDPTSRKITASRTFVVDQPLASAKIPGVVAGFKLASDELATQLIDWTAQELSGETTTP